MTTAIRASSKTKRPFESGVPRMLSGLPPHSKTQVTDGDFRRFSHGNFDSAFRIPQSALIQGYAAANVSRNVQIFAFVNRWFAFIKSAFGDDGQWQLPLLHQCLVRAA